MSDHAHIESITRKFIEQGKLIEAGWLSLRLAAIPAYAPAVQLDEMRKAFFAGAQHVFSSIMVTLEPGEEPTDGDMKRLTLIDAELKAFAAQLTAAVKTDGRG